MMPKEFIQVVLIDELRLVVEQRPYISFAPVTIGFEFIGKALDITEPTWRKNSPKDDWERPFKQLSCLSQYLPHLQSYKLHDCIRNGYMHTFIPKGKINVSSRLDIHSHLEISQTGKLNIKCEQYYEDLVLACKEIINMDFPDPSNKMNKDLLSVVNL